MHRQPGNDRVFSLWLIHQAHVGLKGLNAFFYLRLEHQAAGYEQQRYRGYQRELVFPGNQLLGRQQRQADRYRVDQHGCARAGEHQRREGKQERSDVQRQAVTGAQHQDGLHHHQIDGGHQVGGDRGAIEVELYARDIQPQSLIEGIAVDRQAGGESHDDQQALHAQPLIERDQQNESGRELQFAGRHIRAINIDVLTRLFEVMHPEDGSHAHAEHQRGQQQILALLK